MKVRIIARREATPEDIELAAELYPDNDQVAKNFNCKWTDEVSMVIVAPVEDGAKVTLVHANAYVVWVF